MQPTEHSRHSSCDLNVKQLGGSQYLVRTNREHGIGFGKTISVLGIFTGFEPTGDRGEKTISYGRGTNAHYIPIEKRLEQKLIRAINAAENQHIIASVTRAEPLTG